METDPDENFEIFKYDALDKLQSMRKEQYAALSEVITKIEQSKSTKEILELLLTSQKNMFSRMEKMLTKTPNRNFAWFYCAKCDAMWDPRIGTLIDGRLYCPECAKELVT